jgi:hypothetical protein
MIVRAHLGLFALLGACGGQATTPNDAGAEATGPTDAGSLDAQVDAALADCPTPHVVETVATFAGSTPERDALVAAGGWLYYGYTTFYVQNEMAPSTGGVRRVRRSGEAGADVQSTGYIAGPVVTDGIDLFFFESKATPINMGWWADRTNVLATPLAGGPLRILPPPPNVVTFDWRLQAVGPRSVLFTTFTSHQYTDPAIARWNGSSSAIVASPNVLGVLIWVADATDAYWVDSTDALVAQSLTGGAPRTVAPKVGGYVRAQDAKRIFVTDTSAGIRSVDKATGSIVDIVSQGAITNVFVDEGWVYFVDGNQNPTTIQRIHTTGGSAETFASLDVGEVEAITADECGIYWSFVGNAYKSAIMRQAK